MQFSPLVKTLALALAFCAAPTSAMAHAAGKPFAWEGATVYFVLTDRFNNANPANDLAYGRRADAAVMRGSDRAVQPPQARPRQRRPPAR